MNVILVEPDFPFPNKSKNKAGTIHKNFVPIGLLKLGALHRENGDNVKLVRGNKSKDEIGFSPDKIFVTSLFTYWSSYVWDSIMHYRELSPDSDIVLGGIYATLHKDKEKFRTLSEKYKVNVYGGINREAEKHLPDYSLIPPVDYHATHMMRGCIRKCKFCGTWKLEPERIYKTVDDIIKELVTIKKNKIILYDNNILANPNITDILKAFVDLRINGKPVIFEAQSGFDGRLLENDPELVFLIKKARFRNVRIAWDNSLNDKESIKKQIDFLVKAGYLVKDICVFMIYNFEMPLEEMILKQKNCLKWGVQITDCRYRPLDRDYDNYKPHAWRYGQTSKDYYIHKSAGWADRKIRLFRSLIRIHNIFIRYVKDKLDNFEELFKEYEKIEDPEEVLIFMKTRMGYRRDMEWWSAVHNTYKFFNMGRPPKVEIIKKSSILRKRIRLLNRIKNHHIKNKISPPNWKGLKRAEFDCSIRDILEKEGLSCM